MNTTHFKEKLEQEKERIEGELSRVGRINPDNPKDWEPTPTDLNVMRSDKNEFADTVSSFESRSAIEVELENRLQNIKDALKRIEDGTYGTCRVCEKEIEEKRLEANPSAQTCITHRDSE